MFLKRVARSLARTRLLRAAAPARVRAMAEPALVALGLVVMALVALATGCAQGGPTLTGRSGDAGTFSADDGGACGAPGEACCEGACLGGSECVLGVCEAASCGNAGQPCCSDGPLCAEGLTCLVSGCEASTEPAVPEAPACGMLDEACCAGASPCDAGLTCAAGLCADDAPSCGDDGAACCPGNACDVGLRCESGACAPEPTCEPLGGGCASTTDCCDGVCDAGACRTAPPPDPCASAFDCLDCTDRPYCGWCDGRCVVSDYYGPLDGSYCDYHYAWYAFECF